MLTYTWSSSNWRELAEVAEYLRQNQIADRELVCWHDSTHPLYLMLHVKPAIRFMHVCTAMAIVEHQDDIRQELVDSTRKKYVVSDLLRAGVPADRIAENGPAGPLDLPPTLPMKQRPFFPFDQPIVFRSTDGRYMVHRIDKPIGGIDILDPRIQD